MLSVLPFDPAKDPERPFKAYSRPSSSSLPTSSPYYSAYHQSSYLPSYAGRDRGMDLPVRPPPAHMYDQMSSHHLMDMSQRNMASHNDIKSDPDNMHGYSMPHMSHHAMGMSAQGLHGYGDMPQGPAMHSMPQMPSSTSSHRVTSSMSPTDTKQDSDSLCSSADSLHGNGSNTQEPATTTSASIKAPPKKRALSVPESLKDKTYWDKRKKNNDSAKRSREQRRMKEEQIAMRVVYLEQENLQLRTEVSLLKTEIDKLRCMVYNSVQ